VCDRDLRVEHFRGVYVRRGNALAKAGNLANFLEVEDLAGGIAVDTDAGRIVTTVLLAGETIAKDVANFLAILQREKKGTNQSVLWLVGGAGHVKMRVVFWEVLDISREADG
jgi:hypothetical protein